MKPSKTTEPAPSKPDSSACTKSVPHILTQVSPTKPTKPLSNPNSNPSPNSNWETPPPRRWKIMQPRTKKITLEEISMRLPPRKSRENNTTLLQISIQKWTGWMPGRTNNLSRRGRGSSMEVSRNLHKNISTLSHTDQSAPKTKFNVVLPNPVYVSTAPNPALHKASNSTN